MKTEGRAPTTLLSYGFLAVYTRWVIVLGAAVALPIMEQLDWLGPSLVPLTVLTAMVAGYNLALQWVLRRWRRRGELPLRGAETVRRAVSFADLAVLVGLVYLTGGPLSPFYALFLLGFVFLGLVGRATEPLFHGVLVLLLMTAMFIAEHRGVVPHFAFGPGRRYAGDAVLEPHLLVGILLFWTLLTAAAFVLIHLVRREIDDREARLALRRRQLHESDAFLGRVFEHLPVGIIVVGAGGRIVRTNPVADEIFAIADDGPRNLLRLPRTQATGLAGFFERYVAGEPLELDNFPCVCPNQEAPRWLRLRGVPPRGDEPGILLVEDVSAWKARDDREAALQEQLFQADKLASLGQLASGVAHELNNPLTAILGTAQLVAYMLREGKADPDEMYRRLEHIQMHGKRIETLVRSLLTYARPSREGAKALPVRPLVDELLSFAEFELRRDQVELKVSVADDLPDFLGSKTELQQLMLNLLTNARHAVAAGTGRIDLRLDLGSLQGEPALRIVVADNGPGIAPEVIERIFEPFFTTKDPSQGTGLGLAIVNAIVERYRGRIHIQTELGVGTAFVVELPYHDELPALTNVGEATFSPYG